MFINYLIGVFVFIFGLCIGSFLNCFIYRLEEEKTMQGRSFCPNCKHVLSFLDLFPVFSFLFLGGKCRYCHKKISLQYPLSELVTGILFLLIFYFAPILAGAPGRMTGWIWGLNLVFLFYITSALIIIFIYDLKHYLIPDKILFPAIAVSLIYNLIYYQNILNGLLAVVVGSGFFLFIFLISRGRAMGFGDVKLAILMGFLLGFPNILVALFLAFFFGAIIGLILMIYKGKSLKSEIPFGPFLIAGTFIALLCGNQIIQWYLNFLQV
jgi:leader peptidase (prepilin peptidase) / N-methyltransferase